MNKFHKRTLEKVNKLYKLIYDRTLAANKFADSGKEMFAYLKLLDNIKSACKEFEISIAECEKEQGN